MNAARVYRATAALLLAGCSAAVAQPPAWATLEGSEIAFTATQQRAPVRGRFEEFTAEIRFDPQQLGSSRFDVVVQVGSVHTRNSERDDALRSPDLLHAARWPQSRFEATEFRRVGEDRFEALGSLTLRGQTHPLTLPFTFTQQGSRAQLIGEVVISRLQYGVGQGEFAASDFIADHVQVEYRLVLEQRSPGTGTPSEAEHEADGSERQ